MVKTIIYSTKLKGLEAKQRTVSEGFARPGIVVDSKPVKFAINAVIANYIRKGDDVRVLMIKNSDGSVSKSGKKWDDIVEAECREECEETLKPFECNISYTSIPVLFDGSSANIRKIYLDMIGALEYKSEIYFDMTYGPKFIPFVAFAAFNYTEKYYDSDVKAIYYCQAYHTGAQEKTKNIVLPGSEKICEFTPIYRLNSFCEQVTVSKEAFKYVVSDLFV